MKKIILTIITIIGLSTMQSYAQMDNNWAIGGQIGEPFALNIRKYFQGGERSFDVNIGLIGFIYGKDKTYRDKLRYNQSGIAVQGIYNRQKNISEKLHAYYGIGGQINSRKTVVAVGQINSEKIISLGPCVNAGLEYDLPESDMSIFVNGGTYLELIPKPLLYHLQFNGGIRLNIRR